LPDWASPVVGAEPSWWHAGAASPAVEVPVGRKETAEPSLFDIAETQSPLPDRVIRSKIFTAQVKLAGRVVIKPAQIKNLLTALLGANEITSAQAATALGVATANVNGALMQTKRILDVEGYEVLRVGPGVVSLDVAALTEQFGVRE
jgi:hypothetical protein